MNFMPQTLVVLLAALLVFGCQDGDGQTGSKTERPDTDDAISALISADELSELINADPSAVRILEPAQKLADFSEGHIPGAIFVDWLGDMTDPNEQSTYKNPTAEQFAALMSKLGIKNDDRIVIYDRLANRLSTRLFWTLKYYGHEKIQVLDGGIFAWKAKHDLSNESAALPKTEYRVTKMNDQIVADLALVEKRIAASDAVLVDGRPPEQFTGESPGKVFHTQKEHPRRGHIPGAVNIFWRDNFNQDATFKSVEELRKLYDGAGLQQDQCVITYCNEGLHAAPPWFVLTQLLGYEDVKLYDSSMAEWSRTENPMEEGDK